MEQAVYKEEQKFETHNGKVFALASGTVNHCQVIDNTVCVFKQYLRGKTCKVWSGGIDVHLTDKDCFVPDVTVVCDPKIITNDGIMGTPDLIVEILSPSTARYDRGYKKNVYENCGVKEYWIITIETRSVEVYLLQNRKLELDNIYSINKNNENTEFSTSIFLDLVISLDEIFMDLI